MLDQSVYKGLLVLLDNLGPRELAARLVWQARPEQLAALGRLAQAVHAEIQHRLALRARAGMPGPPGLPDPLAQRDHRARPARTGTSSRR